ncbi:MAG TPA: 5-formyltetrahydrofolate cyclo-ligase [Rhodanobacteraceae bacterium]|nr:5-formyltetrahydrofolate cyclo-ligase [Rhodanobacteraceae bacterium]
MGDSRDLLRARMSLRRNELDAKQRIAAAAGVLRSLERLPEFMVDARIAGYWAVRGELPLNLAVASLARREQQYFLPVLSQARQLHFAEYATGAAVTHNRFGIPEPAVPADRWLTPRDMDVILLPLLAFDRRGHRLGTGGGWYDTSLAFLHDLPRPAVPLLVGVAYAFQEIEAVPAEPWDVDLDYVVTDAELIACTAIGAPT